MIVIIKSAPDTPEGKRGVSLARDMSSDICLIQNAVYFTQKGRLEGFSGTVYVLDEDMKLRGITPDMAGKGIIEIDYDGLVDLVTGKEKVVGVL
ncbi:MAG: DsrH/TusB family sulfur metabolism protein [Nitrospirota bacterium]